MSYNNSIVRRLVDIEKEIDSMLIKFEADSRQYMFEDFLQIIAVATAIQVTDKEKKKLSQDSYVTLRNQIQNFVKNYFREKIKKNLNK